MIVDSLMQKAVLTLPQTASARTAALLMREKGVGGVVVLSGALPAGIVTERDLVQRVMGATRDPDKTSLAEIMSKPLATIGPSATVEEAADMMRKLKLKRLVVVHDGRVVGIVTVTDIAYAEPEMTRGLVEGWVKQRWEG